MITNSIGEGVAEPYAALASEALGHPVRPHSGVVDFVDATQVLLHLQDTAHPPMSELVRNAEIVVVYGEPEEGDFWESCGLIWVKDPNPPSRVHTAADWQQYRTELEAVFSEVRMLRENLPTVLLTIDMPLGMVNRWQPDTLEACIAGWETLNEVHRAAAEAHGVVVVSLFDAFNGLDHDEDPYAKGLIHADRVHTSEAGVALIAKSLAEAGFNPTDTP